MEIIEKNSKNNEYRDQILELLAKYNDEGTPPTAQLSREVLAEDGEELSFDEAIELYYEELTDDLVAMVEKGEVVGFLMIKDKDPYFKNRAPDYWPSLAITHALVDEDYRREGVASELLEYTIEKVCPRKNLPYLVWATSSENNASQRFIQNHGFEKVNTIKDDRKEGVHTLIYAREI
ncbi:MAG: N-acetyltransferase family protein [Candidatus Nanohaloarchaea archaeon]